MKPATSLRLFYSLSSLACLTLLWLLSGLWRWGGFEFFVAGALLLAACLTAARLGRRPPLFALYLVVAMAGFVVGSLEAFLRCRRASCMAPSPTPPTAAITADAAGCTALMATWD